jgi:MoaA/NifB/PqqE/SkfB family radical SAM enzyme
VRASGIPFGFIFTLTQHNLNELDWVARFALEQGAKLLQIHPLEIVGRAEQEIPHSRPDEIEAAYAYVETLRIQEMAGDRLLVQLDLVHRRALRANPERVFAGEGPEDSRQLQLSDLISPLVIEADGTVVPIQHGFDRTYAVGNLHDAPLRASSDRWKRETYPAFRALCHAVFAEVTAPTPLPFLNWYDAIGGRAPFSHHEQPYQFVPAPRSASAPRHR